MKIHMNLQLFAQPANHTGATGMSAEMKTYYEKRLLDQAEPLLVHDQFGDKYPIPANNGEIGKLAGVRFIETSEAKIWTGDGCPTGLAVFGTLVLAAHAYAVTEVEGGGLQHIVKQLGAGEDPLNQRASVGWKAIKTAERLCEQYMVRIESVSPKYSAKAKAN